MATNSTPYGTDRTRRRRIGHLGVAAATVLGITMSVAPSAAAEPSPTQVAGRIAELTGTDVGAVEQEILRVVWSGTSPEDATRIVLDDHVDRLDTALSALAVVSSADVGGIQAAARELSLLRVELDGGDSVGDVCGPGGELSRLKEALAAIGTVSSFDVADIQARVQQLDAGCPAS